VVTLLTGAGMLAGYWRRMDAEEAMLVDALGERYRTYMRHTWRLVPGPY
jgi:protein-S-isoprenylcysteine O-methyltransferase Ste14